MKQYIMHVLGSVSQELYFPDAHLTDIIEILIDISDLSYCNVADQYKSMDADARNCCTWYFCIACSSF